MPSQARQAFQLSVKTPQLAVAIQTEKIEIAGREAKNSCKFALLTVIEIARILGNFFILI